EPQSSRRRNERGVRDAAPREAPVESHSIRPKAERVDPSPVTVRSRCGGEPEGKNEPRGQHCDRTHARCLTAVAVDVANDFLAQAIIGAEPLRANATDRARSPSPPPRR